MKISVIGAGAIGGNLARKLGEAGHDVQGRRPRAGGRRAGRAGDRRPLEYAVKDRDAVVLAIPFGAAGQLADLFASVRIEAVEDGAIESVYTSELLGRPQRALRASATDGPRLLHRADTG